MIHEQQFGFPRVFGFSDGRHSSGRRPTEYYYSQGFRRSMQALLSGYAIVKKKSTDDAGLSSMGNIKWFADNGTLYGIDDAGNVLRETTRGAADFAMDHTVASSNGAGLI